jgi:hypothetical protein
LAKTLIKTPPHQGDAEGFLVLCVDKAGGMVYNRRRGDFVREDELSHKGIIRETMIDKPYINSNQFQRKFDYATDNEKVNKLLYSIAKKILIDRSGTRYESMYWIDKVKGTIITKFERMGKEDKYKGTEFEFRVIYDETCLKKLDDNQRIITIHNHPNSTAPSPNDLNSAYLRKYDIGFTISHDGGLYRYICREPIDEMMFDRYMTKYLNEHYDWNTAQILAYKSLSRNINIEVKEIRYEIHS